MENCWIVEIIGKEFTLSRLKELYEKEAVSALVKEFSYKSVMQVPRLHKIVVNMGVGKATENRKRLEDAEREVYGCDHACLGAALLARWGLPDDVGKAAAMLARGDLPYSTGQVLLVDGGMTLQRL